MILYGSLIALTVQLAWVIIVCGIVPSKDTFDNFVIDAAQLQVGIQQHKYVTRQPRQCPCQDVRHCQRINTIPKKEVFIFSVTNKNWMKYDWTKVTSIVMMNGHNDTLMCYAHSKGVRVLSVANMAVKDLTNQTAQHIWVQKQVDMISDNFLDGVNVDFESAIEEGSHDTRAGLTSYMTELSQAVKSSFHSHVMVSVDFAWSPEGIDSRFYDYKRIGKVVDLVFVMAYDERSQIFGDCVAWANSGYNNTSSGLARYLSIVPDYKLILGIPWYGYKYTCSSYYQINQRCTIRHVPFRGVNCSDAVGHQVDYSTIVKVNLPKSFTGRLWDKQAQSPYFSTKDGETNEVTQFWYDDPESLSLKYKLADKMNLRGVGMWNADCLDYNDPDMVHDMWGALPNSW